MVNYVIVVSKELNKQLAHDDIKQWLPQCIIWFVPDNNQIVRCELLSYISGHAFVV